MLRDEVREVHDAHGTVEPRVNRGRVSPLFRPALESRDESPRSRRKSRSSSSGARPLWFASRVLRFSMSAARSTAAPFSTPRRARGETETSGRSRTRGTPPRLRRAPDRTARRLRERLRGTPARLEEKLRPLVPGDPCTRAALTMDRVGTAAMTLRWVDPGPCEREEGNESETDRENRWCRRWESDPRKFGPFPREFHGFDRELAAFKGVAWTAFARALRHLRFEESVARPKVRALICVVRYRVGPGRSRPSCGRRKSSPALRSRRLDAAS